MKSIFIATPCYEKPMPHCEASVIAATALLQQHGYVVETRIFAGLCYVHTARNHLVREFLVSGMDEVLWWDSDIGLESTEDILNIVEAERDIVGCSAPFRSGDILGFPTTPLATPEGPPIVCPETGHIQVMPLPTALMKVKREVFMSLAREGKARLRIEYGPDATERSRYLSFFDFEADEVNHLEFGEDVTFCRKWDSLGGKIWCIPDITIRHGEKIGNWHDYLRALPNGGGEQPAEWKFKARAA